MAKPSPSSFRSFRLPLVTEVDLEKADFHIAIAIRKLRGTAECPQELMDILGRCRQWIASVLEEDARLARRAVAAAGRSRPRRSGI